MLSTKKKFRSRARRTSWTRRDFVKSAGAGLLLPANLFARPPRGYGIGPVNGGGGGTGLAQPLTGTDALGVQSNMNTTTWKNNVGQNYNLIEMLGTPNAGSAMGVSNASIMSALKTINAAAGGTYCKIIQYQMEEDFWTSPAAAGSSFFNYALYNLLVANPGMNLTSTYPTYTKVNGDPNHSVCQISDLGPTPTISSVGSVAGPGTVNLAQLLAFLEYNQLIAGETGALSTQDYQDALDNTPNPYLDGVEHDNTWMVQRYSGNWLFSTTTYNGATTYSTTGTMLPSVAPHLWAGWKQLVLAWRGYNSNVFQLGNCDHLGWAGAGGLSANYDSSAIGLWDCAMTEHTFNNGGVEFVPSTWTNLLTACVQYEQLLRANGQSYVMALQTGNGLGTGNGNDNWNAKSTSSFTAYPTANNDWQNWRYHFGMCQLLRWIAGQRNVDSANIKMFDEQGGTNGLGLQWKGLFTGARNLTTPWLAVGPYGIWKVPAANGFDLVNPRGNGAHTFSMGSSGHFLPTTTNHGDPHYNTGLSFNPSTQITLQDRDAITCRST